MGMAGEHHCSQTARSRCSHAEFWSKNTQCRTTMQKWVSTALLQHCQLLPALLGSACCWFLPAQGQTGSCGCSVFTPSSSNAAQTSPAFPQGIQEISFRRILLAGWVPLPPNPPRFCSVRVVLEFLFIAQGAAGGQCCHFLCSWHSLIGRYQGRPGISKDTGLVWSPSSVYH